jgi:MFS family permease
MTHLNNYAIATILSLQIACHCIILTVGQYIYASYLEIYSNSSNTTQNVTTHIIPSFYLLKTVSSVSNQCIDNTTTSSNNAQLWAQEQSADLVSRIDLWNSCPMVIMTYILGLYTPKLGRRFVLILPMVGTAVQLAIWLAIIYFHLADYWWYIASFIVGLPGSNYVLSRRIIFIYIYIYFFFYFLDFVLSLIITDNTKENDRSSRFVLFEAITTAVSAVVTFGIGYYINWRGFTDLYWISLGLQILSIVIVIFFFKNSSHTITENTPLLSSPVQNNVDIQIKESHSLKTKCKDCLIIFKVFSFQNRSRTKSISLLLTLFAYIFYLLAYSTYSSFLWYVLDTPFCWSSENYGNYTALALIFSAVFSFLGMKLFTRIGMNDAIICTLSHLFFTASSLWIAFAKYSWQLYAGLLISPYADYQNSLTLPMMSKWLEPHERNHAFTFVAEVNTIITTFGNSIFNWVYAQTVAHFRNFTLLLAASFSIISFILNM